MAVKVKARKKPKKAAKSREVKKAAVMADLRAEVGTISEIANKHGVNASTVASYKSQLKRATLEAKVRADFPADSPSQIKRFLGHLCEIGSACSIGQAKDIAAAVDVVGKLNLVYEGRASSITATESKNSTIDLKEFTTEDLKTLARVEQMLAGRRPVQYVSGSNLEQPVIYSDTEPSCVAPAPEPEPSKD